MPRLELGEYIARVVTDELGPRPGLRDPDETEVPKIRRFAERLEAKYGHIGIGDWAVRGVGRVVFGLRRARLTDIAWADQLPRWIALARRLTTGHGGPADVVDETDSRHFDTLASFLEEVQTGRSDRAPLESIEAWTRACARASAVLSPSPDDDARYPREDLVSDRQRLRDLWDFLWRTHVGTDHMPMAPWSA